MIDIDIKLVPFGILREKKIGKMQITNVSTYKDRTDYSYCIESKNWQGKSFMIKGMIENHNRSENIFILIKKILDKESERIKNGT